MFREELTMPLKARWIFLGVALLVVLYSAPPARALSIRIDDSSDTLNVTSDSTATQIVTGTGDTITDANGNQFFLPIPAGGREIIEWAAITDSNLPTTATFGLYVLESGTTIQSDLLDSGQDLHTLIFISDVDGQPLIGLRTLCSNPVAGTSCVTETGNYEEVASILYPGATNLSIQYRSDPALDVAVPEPTTLALVGWGLVGFAGVAWKRRRK
jgi:PEP-CTERM motif-containing protein